jgi:hypothetical protein
LFKKNSNKKKKWLLSQNHWIFQDILMAKTWKK